MPLQDNEKKGPLNPDLIQKLLQRKIIPIGEGTPQAKQEDNPLAAEPKEEAFITTEKSP